MQRGDGVEIYNGTVQETNKNGNAITKKILLTFEDTPEFWSDIEQKQQLHEKEFAKKQKSNPRKQQRERDG
jgi:hypothetical protein